MRRFARCQAMVYTRAMFLRASSILVAVLGIGVLVVGGWFFTTQRQGARIAALLEQRTAALADAYRGMADTQVFPAEQSAELTMEQRETIAQLRQIYDGLSGNLSVSEKVNAISEMQSALIKYARQSPNEVALRDALGEQGAMTALLHDYNDAARQWNQRNVGFMGRLAGQVMPQTDDSMPYLRFDGFKDFNPTISM